MYTSRSHPSPSNATTQTRQSFHTDGRRRHAAEAEKGRSSRPGRDAGEACAEDGGGRRADLDPREAGAAADGAWPQCGVLRQGSPQGGARDEAAGEGARGGGGQGGRARISGEGTRCWYQGWPEAGQAQGPSQAA
jgi:hypothetical protein